MGRNGLDWRALFFPPLVERDQGLYRQGQLALGVAKAGHLVEQALATIARGMHARGVRRFVVAGGETSGAVVQALEVRALRIGQQIDPGVPATVTLDAQPIALALKSGNFGSVDFFEKALRHLEGTQTGSTA